MSDVTVTEVCGQCHHMFRDAVPAVRAVLECPHCKCVPSISWTI